LAPDGIERVVLTVNGTVPGPTIEANWGDDIVVHVTNNLANNGSGIHWHGIRQNWTNPADGPVSITQCPVAVSLTPEIFMYGTDEMKPGDNMTYSFKATQYGTSWYHSHFELQAWDGIFGIHSISLGHSCGMLTLSQVQ
jgi:FtsP/CotA-like multicopper oxidase with cupredoxin domain